MQMIYTRKNDTTQRSAENSSFPVLDSSSQSESLQRKADMVNNAAQRAETTRPNNTGMPDNLKFGIESLSGFSMDNVRVHYNSSKPASVQALAYTQGTDVHVAPGQEKCLPHEAWHVAQQMAGRVSPTTNINGLPVNDNAGLEHEADVMGEKAVQCKKDKSITSVMKNVSLGTVQLYSRGGKDYKTVGDLRNWMNNLGWISWIWNYDLNRLRKIEGFDLGYFDLVDIQEADSVGAIITKIESTGPSLCKKESFLVGSYGGEPNYFEGDLDRNCYCLYVKFYNRIFSLKEMLSKDVSASIKDAFFINENINTIIGKFFSKNTGAFLGRAVFENVNFKENVFDVVFPSIKKGISETLSDINYWAEEKDKKKVEKIDLTDSDVHCRGVGVCIVTYEGGKRCVIKPEDKSLEKAIYGKDENSLAEKYEKIIYGKDENSLADKFEKVGTLDIQVSPENNFHGSRVEYYDHSEFDTIRCRCDLVGDDINKVVNEYESSLNEIIVFSSLLGLRDLHGENLVYSNNSKNVQLIDAEMALAFKESLSENPFYCVLDTETTGGKTSISSSFRDNYKDKTFKNKKKIFFENLNKYTEFLEQTKTKFQGKKSRLTLISTQDLFGIREKAYENENSNAFWNSEFDKKTVWEKYQEKIICGLENYVGVKKAYINFGKRTRKRIYKFLRSGKIPYFEYDFEKGLIYQKFEEGRIVGIYQHSDLKLENVIKRRKKILNDAFKKYSNPSPESEPINNPIQ